MRKRIVEQEDDEVWDILAEIVKEHPVLLNRAPTLHRLGIQAFEPVLNEGKAIQLHPLVCTAYNADFDGDQMAVHVPLSLEAQTEARVLMMSTNNILSPANGRPIINPSQDVVLGLYWMTRLRHGAKGEGRVFSSIPEVLYAYETGHIDIQAGIKVRVNGKIEETTTGRAILADMVPPEVSFDQANQLMTKKQVANLIDSCFRISGNKATVLLADRLMRTGFKYSTIAGISICSDDMIVPKSKQKLIDQTNLQIREIHKQYDEGLITDGERYNKVLDLWTQTSDKVAKELMNEIEFDEFEVNGEKKKVTSFNNIYVMFHSGARGSAAQIRQLAGMRGLMAKPSGAIIESPITANFREGLSVLQYFISTHGARKGLADTALKTANSGYLTRRLVDVAQDCIVLEHDCNTDEGMTVRPLIEGGEIIQTLGERMLGRVSFEDIQDPYTDNIILRKNDEITEEKVLALDEAGIDVIKIRSVLTCKTSRGVCAMCYGRDLACGNIVNLGEAVGIIAAQSIGEPGTQLTMRTFHLGGTATRSIEQSIYEARRDGTVRFDGLATVRNRDNKLVVMNRNGEVIIQDDTGRERDRFRLVYGAILELNEGDSVKSGQLIAEWDPYSTPIVTEVDGFIKYEDITEGSTISEQVDSVTGFSTKVITEGKEAALKPSIVLVDKSGANIKSPNSGSNIHYRLPVGAQLLVASDAEVKAGDVIAKIHRETTKTKDITGGLPRVAELFEARKPKESAIVTEIDGYVSFGKDLKGKQRVTVTPEEGKGDPREYLIPKGKHIAVREGEYVKAGEALMDGSTNPHDILAVLGDHELASYIVNEIQEVYRLQGVPINDKHIEIIVRQMLKRVKVVDSGDTGFLLEERVEKYEFEMENKRIVAEGGAPARAEPLLLGITKASLSTESWISAASFQETTKVLTEAAICGAKDNLKGLKENIIMGRLIPAGTGLSCYKKWKVEIDNEHTSEV